MPTFSILKIVGKVTEFKYIYFSILPFPGFSFIALMYICGASYLVKSFLRKKKKKRKLNFLNACFCFKISCIVNGAFLHKIGSDTILFHFVSLRNRYLDVPHDVGGSADNWKIFPAPHTHWTEKDGWAGRYFSAIFFRPTF